MYSDSNETVQAYADMVTAKKQQYIRNIVDIIDCDGNVEDWKLHKLYDNLREYVILDLTYVKLLDIYTDL